MKRWNRVWIVGMTPHTIMVTISGAISSVASVGKRRLELCVVPSALSRRGPTTPAAGRITSAAHSAGMAAGSGAASELSSRNASPRAAARRRRVVLVLDAIGRAAITLQLGFDPVDSVAVAFGALAAVAKLCKALDRRLVSLEVKTADKSTDWIVCGCRPGLLPGNRQRCTDNGQANE